MKNQITNEKHLLGPNPLFFHKEKIVQYTKNFEKRKL